MWGCSGFVFSSGEYTLIPNMCPSPCSGISCCIFVLSEACGPHPQPVPLRLSKVKGSETATGPKTSSWEVPHSTVEVLGLLERYGYLDDLARRSSPKCPTMGLTPASLVAHQLHGNGKVWKQGLLGGWHLGPESSLSGRFGVLRICCNKSGPHTGS